MNLFGSFFFPSYKNATCVAVLRVQQTIPLPSDSALAKKICRCRHEGDALPDIQAVMDPSLGYAHYTYRSGDTIFVVVSPVPEDQSVESHTTTAFTWFSPLPARIHVCQAVKWYPVKDDPKLERMLASASDKEILPHIGGAVGRVDALAMAGSTLIATQPSHHSQPLPTCDASYPLERATMRVLDCARKVLRTAKSGPTGVFLSMTAGGAPTNDDRQRSINERPVMVSVGVQATEWSECDSEESTLTAARSHPHTRGATATASNCEGDEATVPPESDEATVPTEGDEATVPTEGDEATVPTEGDEATVPTEGDEATVPTEGDEATVPTEGDEATVPTEGDEGATVPRGATSTSDDEFILTDMDGRGGVVIACAAPDTSIVTQKGDCVVHLTAEEVALIANAPALCLLPGDGTTATKQGVPAQSQLPPLTINAVVDGVVGHRVRCVVDAFKTECMRAGMPVDVVLHSKANQGSAPVSLWLHCDGVTRNVPVSTAETLCVAILLNSCGGARDRTVVMTSESHVDEELSRSTFAAMREHVAKTATGGWGS